GRTAAGRAQFADLQMRRAVDATGRAVSRLRRPAPAAARGVRAGGSRLVSDEALTPRFRRGVRFRFDEARQTWILLAPEKLFTPEGTAIEILKRVDGVRTLGSIIDDLAKDFAAPRDLIAADVSDMLDDLSAKGVVSLLLTPRPS